MASIDPWLDKLLEIQGSDLHLGAGVPPLARYRGDLVPIDTEPLEAKALEAFLRELTDATRWRTYQETGDLDFSYAYGSKARFRANYYRKTTGVAAVFRTIPSRVLSAQELGLPAICLRMAERRSGLVLVTGPAGSGKSTTLAALVDHVNKSRDGHILTVEDPVEFVHQPQRCQVTQREVGHDTPGFAEAIHSAAREDADVIMVGELQGAETMRLALQLASFGVLVFATVVTNSAGATIERIVNAFPASQQPQIRGMLADALAGVVAQQLLKRADGTGRIAAFEVLMGTMAVSSAIREAKTGMIPSLIQSGARDGMQSMDAALEKLMNERLVSPLDAAEKASDKESFLRNPLAKQALQAAGELPEGSG